MAEGKIRSNTHIIEAKSLLCLQTVFPIDWVQRKMEPDYGIDIDLELFDYEDDVCVTLGEHVFLQVKGTESPEYVDIKPIGEQIYTKKELEEKQVSVLKFTIDVPLLKLVERMGSTIPVLLVVVDLKEQVPYYVCLNDYVHNVLHHLSNDYKKQKTVTIYVPKENVLNPNVALWYGKRAKLYGLFQELFTLSNDVRLCNAEHKVDIMSKRLKTIVLSDAWSVCQYWPALANIKNQLEEMLDNNMISDIGRHLLDRLVKEGEDPSTEMIYYGDESTPITATLAAQMNSCNTFLDMVQATGAIFENNVRHMGLPTQINWMFSN